MKMVYETEPPLTFEFEKNPRTDYLVVKEREEKDRFSLGQFLMQSLPFKEDIMSDIYESIGVNPQYTYVCITHDDAIKKVKLFHADIHNRTGAQLVAVKGLQEFKEAGVNIGDQIITINGTQVDDWSTEKIVEKLMTEHMD